MLGNANVFNPTGHCGLAALISCRRASMCFWVGVWNSPSAVLHRRVAPHRSIREPSWRTLVSFSTYRWDTKMMVRSQIPLLQTDLWTCPLSQMVTLPSMLTNFALLFCSPFLQIHLISFPTFWFIISTGLLYAVLVHEVLNLQLLHAVGILAIMHSFPSCNSLGRCYITLSSS